MRILVTGGKGTLGKKLVAELEARGHNVWTCGRSHEEAKHIRADVSETRQVEGVFNAVKPDVCYHLAAEFGRVNGQHYPEQLWKTNCLGTRNVIDACVRHSTYLVFASSSEAYGDTIDGALFEDDVNRKVPTFHNEYALTKYTNEKQIQIAVQSAGLQATILRFCGIYGPGEKYTEYRNVICVVIYRLLKNLPVTIYRRSHRAFLYVDDWARTVANVADRLNRIPNGALFNVGSDDYISIEHLASQILKEMNCPSQITYFDTEKNNSANKRPYTEKAKCQLGHQSLVGLSDGLRRTIAWMREEYGQSKSVSCDDHIQSPAADGDDTRGSV